MAADIGVKMSVSGVNQFKSSMNQAKSSVKALDAELKLNSAQFKATGDAETYMAQRTKILSDQIKEQESVVANAEKALETMATQGVDKASTSYTQMQAALAKAKTDLLQMQQAANDTGDSLKDAASSADGASESLKSIDKGIKFQNISSALDKVDGLLKNILNKAIEIGKSIWNWGREGAGWGDTMSTTAQMYGMDAETLQRWDRAAKKINTDVDTIIKASDKLMASTKSAEDGVAQIVTSEGEFGIALKNAEGETRDMTDVFWEFLDVLSQVENETDRNALAQEYFGKSYRELIPLIEAGRDAWDEAAASAAVVSNEDVDKLNDLNDTFDEFDQLLDTTSKELLAALAPALGEVAEALMHMLELVRDWAQSEEGQETLSKLGESVAGLITRFANTDFEALFDKVTGAVEKVANFFSTLTSEETYNGVKTLIGLFAGLKVSSSALRFANALSNLAGAGSGGAAASGAANAAGVGAGASGVGVGAAGGTALTAAGVAAVAAVGAQTAYYVYEANKNFERGYNDNDYVSGTGQYDAEGTWKGTAAKYGKEVRYGADIANAAIKFPNEFLYWDAENGSGIFSGFNTNVNDTYIKLGEALAKGLISESDYYRAESRLDEAQKLFDAFVYGNNEYGIYGFKDYEHKLNALSGGSAESGAQEYSEFANLIDGILYEVAQLVTGLNDLDGKGEEAGEDVSTAFGEGVTENIDAAYNAGAALGAAFAAGAASAAGGYRTSEINNFENINAVNVYGATNPAEILAMYRQEMQKNIAGYGG